MKHIYLTFAATYSDYYKDPDKRDYIVSNEKLEKTGWRPIYSLRKDGIEELIKTYSVLISDLSSKYRNGFPLSYGNRRSIYYKERSWNDFHIYSSKVLTGGVKIIQPSVYHEHRGEISTTYHSDYYDRLIPIEEREKELNLNTIDTQNLRKVYLEVYIGMIRLGKWYLAYMVRYIW